MIASRHDDRSQRVSEGLLAGSRITRSCLTMMLMMLMVPALATAKDDGEDDTRSAHHQLEDQDFEESDSVHETVEKESDEEEEDSGKKEEEGEGDETEPEDEHSALGEDSNLPITEVVGGRFLIPTIQAASTATHSIGNGSVPQGFRSNAPRPITPLPEQASDRFSGGQEVPWDWTVMPWTAANTFSHPRYFEDVMLERHGHQRWGHLQPIASGMRFFTTVPLLPYKMAIKPPCECEYTMGYHRTGSCAPTTFQRPPWDRKAIIAETAAVVSGILIFP